MSGSIDRILAILDVGLQHSTETGYPVEPRSGEFDYDDYDAELTPAAVRPSRIARVWRGRIDSGRFSKAECLQFTQAVVRVAAGYSARGKRTNLQPWEAHELVAYLRGRGGVSLTPDHTAQGLAWLQRHGPRVLGVPAGLVRLFGSFGYHGEARVDGGSTLPVWRVHLTDGRAFDYYNAAWQTGNGRGWWWVGEES